ncbi:hypothetical protein AAE478_005637 [Parahypoxylon ruwenzoriense]
MSPKVPTLYSALSAGEMATNPTVYGSFTNTFILEKGEIVQIIVNNLDTGRHPFHLHGHHFQAIYRSEEDAGTFEDSNVTEADYQITPMRRDTLVLYPTGNIVLRFRADNPEWHVASGLRIFQVTIGSYRRQKLTSNAIVATFVEAPLDLQKTLTIPRDHLDACAAKGVPTAGNAAGNTANLLDLTGEPRSPDRLPDGFTMRGKVALAFSCLCGILGVMTVAWYGLAPDATAASWGEQPVAGAQSVDSGVRSLETTANSAEPELIEVTATSVGGSKKA